MRTIFLILCFFVPLSVYSQCPSTSQCVPNEDVARATAAAIELKASRAALESFKLERTATDAERAAANRVIDRLNAVVAVQDRMNLEYQKVIDLYKSVVAEQGLLIEKLTKQLNRPKSAWEKLAATMKTILTILAGVTIGAAL